ncbi:hypothetical protein TrRE_jg12966 [Triparma retinervis]|uniref:Uncharacterized protein n=1 Tax=Triparma retinervis TaxID=2557542 RepID=A0A9W7FVS2_9STRA|nr:hypothetical protein TrRE_jg12966 [Triparma retinervis]
MSYVTLVLLPTALLVPTGVLGLVTAGAARDVMDSLGVSTLEGLLAGLSASLAEGARGAMRDTVVPRLRENVLPRVREMLDNLRPGIMDMSVHEFMVSGAFMRRYGFMAIYMAGLEREDIESILANGMGERERNMVMEGGGIGRMIGWDAMEGMLDAAAGEAAPSSEGAAVVVASGGGDLHFYDDSSPNVGLDDDGTASLPSTPLGTRVSGPSGAAAASAPGPGCPRATCSCAT